MKKFLITALFSLVSVVALADGTPYAAKLVEKTGTAPAVTSRVVPGIAFRLTYGNAATDAETGCTYHYNAKLFLVASGMYPCFTVTRPDGNAVNTCMNGYYPGLLIQKSWAPTGTMKVPGCKNLYEMFKAYAIPGTTGYYAQIGVLVGAFTPEVP